MAGGILLSPPSGELAMSIRSPACSVLAAFFMTVALAAFGQESSGRKYALLIGVQEYDKNELRDLQYAEKDVTDLADVLRQAGYKKVTLMTRPVGSRELRYLPLAANIRKELDGFLDGKTRDDTVIVAFAGHGIQFKKDDMPYFCPADARLADRTTLISLGEVYKALEQSQAGVKLLLVDACRNKPRSDFSRARAEVDLESVTRPEGLQPPSGVAALFASSEGQEAYESPTLKHGVFFHFVIEGFKGKAANPKGLVTLDRLRSHVREHVYDYVWDEFRRKQMPASRGKDEGIIPLAQVASLLSAREITNTIGMKLVKIPAGRFTMGSPANEQGRNDDEGPAHEVEITRPFYMGAHEVRVQDFAAFVRGEGYRTEAEKASVGASGYNSDTRWYDLFNRKYSWRNPGFTQEPTHPVVNVTWNDAVAFCRWLSAKEGKTYDLPTEAEWEYACRAGTTTRFHSGDSAASLERVCNLTDQSLKPLLDANYSTKMEFAPWNDGYPFTAPVGSFQPNNFGLYDMQGNVGEWCKDWYAKQYYAASVKNDPQGPYSGKYRVSRGGAWNNDARLCRSAWRCPSDPGYRDCYLGFRAVLRVP
jgi:formylglycine-generating enzyme required for sulfatase activity